MSTFENMTPEMWTLFVVNAPISDTVEILSSVQSEILKLRGSTENLCERIRAEVEALQVEFDKAMEGVRKAEAERN